MKRKTLFILTLLALSTSALASGKRIYCHSHRKEKIFVVQGERVAFFKLQDFSSNFRAVASVDSQHSRKFNKSLTKVLFHEGKRHKIFIKDENQYSEVDDFIQITSKEGHRMTYPINCTNL
jgi:hypothetical protein